MGPALIGVDADVLLAELGGKVTDGGFKGGLGGAHDVVVGEDLVGAEVGEGEDAAAIGHEGGGGAGEGDERVDADVMRNAEVFTLGVENGVLDVGREADGVDEDVDGAVGGFELGEDGFDLVVVGYVALEGSCGLTLGGGKLGGEGFGFALEAFGLVADGEGGAGFGELLCDGPGDGALVGEAEDDGDFAGEVDHELVSPLIRISRKA